MNEKEKFTFEEVFKQNENRIYYHMHKLGIRSDPYGEFYSEGLFALWNAYRQYEPQKGPLSTYFNYTIRHHFIDTIRKKLNSMENEENFIEGEIRTAYNGNKYGDSKMPIMDSSDITITDEKMWEEAFSILSEKQKKWLYYYIIRDMSLKDIAEKENVTVEAVKSWGKAAKSKLREYFKGKL